MSSFAAARVLQLPLEGKCLGLFLKDLAFKNLLAFLFHIGDQLAFRERRMTFRPGNDACLREFEFSDRWALLVGRTFLAGAPHPFPRKL